MHSGLLGVAFCPSVCQSVTNTRTKVIRNSFLRNRLTYVIKRSKVKRGKAQRSRGQRSRSVITSNVKEKAGVHIWLKFW